MLNNAQLTLDDYIDKYTNPVFINEFDERFNLTKINDEVGIINGSETSHEDIYLVNGFGLDFNIFSDDELLWLSHHFCLDKPLYGDLDISVQLFKNSERDGYTYLGDDYCPICLKQYKDFEIHHIIAAMVGGSDAPYNRIKICLDCHAIETRGSQRYRWSIFNILQSHQLYHFGPGFFLCQRFGNSRYKERHIKQCDELLWNIIKSICKYWGEYYKETGGAPEWPSLWFNHQRPFSGSSYRDDARKKFHYFRQVFLGTIPFEYIEQRIFCELSN